MNCCPLSESDEAAEVYDVSRPKAAKEHRCSECRGVIPRGATHELVSMLFDGEWSKWRTCSSCSDIREHFACGRGAVIGELWSDLADNFFPDMKAGGPCLHGLSPDNKARMFRYRMAWLMNDRWLRLPVDAP